jgi:hypothetical protein
MKLYIIPLFLPEVYKKVKYRGFKYLLQFMGIYSDAILIDRIIKKDNSKEEIKNHLLGKDKNWPVNIITDILRLEFEELELYICFTKYTVENLSLFGKIRFHLNMYSPWDNTEIKDIDIESDNESDNENGGDSEGENINVCTYVLDLCDNHHIYNHYLHDRTISCGDNFEISLYTIFEELIDNL